MKALNEKTRRPHPNLDELIAKTKSNIPEWFLSEDFNLSIFFSKHPFSVENYSVLISSVA